MAGAPCTRCLFLLNPSYINDQVIDDTIGHTLVAANTVVKDVKSAIDGSTATKASVSEQEMSCLTKLF